MAIDLQQSILCDVCSNAGRGVKLPGKKICLDCAGNDPELVRQMFTRHRRDAQKLEEEIKAGASSERWRTSRCARYSIHGEPLDDLRLVPAAVTYFEPISTRRVRWATGQ